jgi:hypothetical protein
LKKGCFIYAPHYELHLAVSDDPDVEEVVGNIYENPDLLSNEK